MHTLLRGILALPCIGRSCTKAVKISESSEALFLHPHHEFVPMGSGLGDRQCLFYRGMFTDTQKIMAEFKAEHSREKKRAVRLNIFSCSQSF